MLCKGGIEMSGSRDETGVSWTAKNPDGTPRQDNSKFFKDTPKYKAGEHIYYDRQRGYTGYRGANMTDADKQANKELRRGK